MAMFGRSGVQKATEKLFGANTTREAEAQLAKGADIDGYDVPHMGRLVPLNRHAHQGNAAMVSMLLTHGANPNLAGITGDTALHEAANRGTTNVIPLLIAAGADIEAKDPRGNTPLHRSVMPGNLAATRMLLEHGANPNARSEEGTPLSLASRQLHSNDLEMSQLLREHGATDY